MSSQAGTLPNLIVIGAQKCATSSLHYYLSLHPDIIMSREKELNFFSTKHNWPRGVDWYKTNFYGKAKYYGESSPEYTDYPRQYGVAERMAALIPQAKLIYIVRDPIERIISHYVHLYSRNMEDRPLDDALQSLQNNHYLNRSLYFMQLEQYIAQFPASQILVIATESLLSQRRETLQQVFRFLEIDDQFYSEKFTVLQHRSSYKRRKNRTGRMIEQSWGGRLETALPMNIRWYIRWLLYWPFSEPIQRPVLHHERRQQLQAALQADVEKLRAYTGQRFANWSL